MFSLQNYKFLIIIPLFPLRKLNSAPITILYPPVRTRKRSNLLRSVIQLSLTPGHSRKLTRVLLVLSSVAESSLTRPYHTPSLAKSRSTPMFLPPASITMLLGIESVS